MCPEAKRFSAQSSSRAVATKGADVELNWDSLIEHLFPGIAGANLSLIARKCLPIACLSGFMADYFDSYSLCLCLGCFPFVCDLNAFSGFD